ncbi:hypothetical protein WICMUC_004509 [Wickerhamomyces mucosus]|uniref:Fe2OG dioxygenase domain-containing protein n=1 Tax=Wickerhamomyces mucosus TaxID=1378264 RepID=A0A9P8PH70_9ASCO|nr:hypothetical protein WICMUC_004509 [Wickerhamomyces mucosus]
MSKRVIPDVDLSLLETKRELVLADLKYAIMEFGFFYIVNYENYLDGNIVEALHGQSEKFFELELEEKNKIQMSNSKHFLGYNGLEKENTGGKVDWREQIDFCSTDAVCSETQTIYDNLSGPNQYPSSEKIPLFKKAVKDFFQALDKFSITITKLIFESLNVEQDEYSMYFNLEEDAKNFNKMKIIKYPSQNTLKDLKTEKLTDQGCGAHRDSDFLTYLFDLSQVTALQVQSLDGAWIDVPSRPQSLIVNVGQTLEYLTNGVCLSSIHRVISPKKDYRISIPFFQNVKISSILKPFKMSRSLIYERDERNRLIDQNVSFQFKPRANEPIAKSIFFNRIKSHRDVSQKWYPLELKEIDEKAEKGTKVLDGLEENAELLDKFRDLAKLFGVVNNTITLAIMKTIADIDYEGLLEQVSSLSRKKIKSKELLQLITIWPDFAKFHLNEDGRIIIDTDDASKRFLVNSMYERNDIFREKCEKWYESNKKAKDIPPFDISLLHHKYINSSPRKKNKQAVLLKTPRKSNIELAALELSSKSSIPWDNDPFSSPSKELSVSPFNQMLKRTITKSPIKRPGKIESKAVNESPPVTPLQSPTKIKREGFLDSPSKNKATGSSMLERIRQKETARKLSFVSPEKKRLLFLDSKTPKVLAVLTGLRPDKPHSIEILVERVVNSLSLSLPISDKEARELILNLAVKFPETFVVVKTKLITVLRWKDFDINELAENLANIQSDGYDEFNRI